MKYLLVLTVGIFINSYSYSQPIVTKKLQLKTSYQVEWIGQRPLIDASYLNIILDKDNKAYGLSGCNYWSTSYELKDKKISFNPALKMTKKICAPALMEQEQRFVKMLPTVNRWDFSEQGQLRLWSKKDASIKLWQEHSNTKTSD